jgi:hypothetical protein
VFARPVLQFIKRPVIEATPAEPAPFVGSTL